MKKERKKKTNGERWDNITILLLIIIVSFFLLLSSLVKVCRAESVQLPFNGIHPKMDQDEFGNWYMISFPDYNDLQIMFYDPQTGLYEKVPGSENRFLSSRDLAHSVELQQ